MPSCACQRTKPCRSGFTSSAAAGSPAALANRTDVRLWVADTEGNDRVHHDTVFNGKGN